MYRVLYRKWRPKVFADVIGQPQVTTTLSAQIRENRLSHAYLFTGSRGTGKTTCAKIFSKAVNCLHPVNGDPCNECEICKGIDNGSVLDIVEIDAASNRGIDDIRLLRDEVNFTPNQAKYRVYIIDEVHMLTIEAFNALLKTLEEPPEHVKFILATTEVHKLPSTILSRCQRFDFRRIEPTTIAQRLVEIAKAENAELDFEAAVLIARIADGGMRDALSLLDRCISVADKVTTDVVSSSAGLMNREYIYSLMDAIADKDTAKCLSILDELHKASCDTERLCTELIDRFRSFLIIKTVQHPENLLICTDEELERIKASSERFAQDQVLYSLRILSAASEAIRKTQNRRIEAEMALIRLCRPETDESTAALMARIASLEKEIEDLKRSGIKVTATPVQTTPSQTFSVNSAAQQPKTETAPVKSEPTKKEFSGFAAEEKTGTDYAAMFAAVDEEEDEAPPAEEFDFEAFMAENTPPEKSGEATGGYDEDIPFADEEFPIPADEDFPPPADDFDAPPIQDNEPMPFDEPEQPADDFNAPLPGKPIDQRTWIKIVLETESAFNPLIGMLSGSTASIVGQTVYIKVRDKNLTLFADEKILSQYASPAASAILKGNYTVKLYRK